MEAITTDITFSIRFDENCTCTVARDELAGFLAGLPGVTRETSNEFLYHEGDRAHIYLLLDCARQQEDRLVSCHPSPDTINCVRLLMRASERNEQTEQACRALASQIARRLRWRIHDDSEANTWLVLDNPAGLHDKPWWRFWD